MEQVTVVIATNKITKFSFILGVFTSCQKAVNWVANHPDDQYTYRYSDERVIA